uniref:Uncharacterized protein n=1 Tax=Grammatophora oceanica TaxID=210454 RepID=A0A7S1YD63_9STRA|mmetsp:Transcript_43023/g.63818  ORF Transcript_43023/g.63818 Transcript_43023/m.63818 type:complete len:108 (+) Transcript_43023:92-415(+)
MDTVEIKGSNIPLLRSILDGGLRLSSRNLADVLEQTVSSYTTPRPIFRTTYLTKDGSLRISRDQDDNVFVYIKEESETSEPTDYSNVPSDLGINKLWEGFRESILQQ